MRNRRLNRRHVILISINLVLLLLLSIVFIRVGSLKGMLLSQQAAVRFAGQSDNRFAQITAFYPMGSGITSAEIDGFKESLEGKMIEASLEMPENGSLWIDGWSMSGTTLQVKGARGNSTASAIGVGGDYFFFHPLRLRSGSYISGSDFSNDLVVLNEELAWQLFGAYNVKGMEVTINGLPYVVAGVVEMEKDFANTKANTDGPCIYMSYERLADRESALFDCYEIVLADPVSGFALKTVTEGLGADAEIIQNTGRFGMGGIWTLIRDFGERSMQKNGIVYPYWENAARIVEDNLALMYVLALLLSVFPFICLIILIVKASGWLKLKKKVVLERGGDIWDKFRTRNYKKPNGNE